MTPNKVEVPYGEGHKIWMRRSDKDVKVLGFSLNLEEQSAKRQTVKWHSRKKKYYGEVKIA